ncbi:hypothetical protein IC620_07800 [Hazenella sp. IB182357]|uniref:Uncharacterized protein n=1 Tax=Polycladospora coralii TaxID=2771432 RepID=A0A926N9L5_9BACL|nr:hypothetical protein [Polycladospora coralii]MBD1372263.1 hypothetical protein [Polycladospora coralii]MBS7530762.1 hypothetical protein [Polycladospora coralii]
MDSNEEQEEWIKRAKSLESEMEKIRIRKRKFQMMYVDELISKEDYRERLQELTAEEEIEH